MSEIKKVMEKMHELETLLEEDSQTPAPFEPSTPFSATGERPRRNTINSSSKERLDFTDPIKMKSALTDLESMISSQTSKLKSLQKSEGKRRQSTTDISMRQTARNLDGDLSSVDTTIHTSKTVFSFESSRTTTAAKLANLQTDPEEGVAEESPRSKIPENPFKNTSSNSSSNSGSSNHPSPMMFAPTPTTTTSNHRAMMFKDFPVEYPPIYLSPSKPGGEMGSNVSLATDESVESIHDNNHLNLSPHTITVDNVQDHMEIRSATVRFGQTEYKLSNLVIDSEEDIGDATDVVNTSITGEHDHMTTPHHINNANTTSTQQATTQKVQDEYAKEQQSFLRHSSGYQLRANGSTITNHLTPDHSSYTSVANGSGGSGGSNASSHLPSERTSFYTNSSYSTNHLNPNLQNLNTSSNLNASMMNLNFANEMDIRVLRRHLNVYMLKNALLKEEVKQVTTVTEEKVREILLRVERMEGERERWRAESLRAKDELLTEHEELLFIRGQLQSKSARVVDLEAELLASQRYASALQREITVWRSTPSTPQQGGNSYDHSTMSTTSISRIQLTSSSHHTRYKHGSEKQYNIDLSPYEAILMLIESAPHDKDILMNYIRDLHREKHALETKEAELELHLEQMEHEHRDLLRLHEQDNAAAVSNEELHNLKQEIHQLTIERDQLTVLQQEHTIEKETLLLKIDQLRSDVKEKDDALFDLERQHADLEDRLDASNASAVAPTPTHHNHSDSSEMKKVVIEVVTKKSMIPVINNKKLSIIQQSGWTRLLCLLFVFQVIFWIMLLICARLYFQVALMTDNEALLRGVYRLRLTR